MNYTVLNILDIIDDSEESMIKEALSAFSCPQNEEIEEYAREKAIDFAKRKLSISYIVFDNADSQIVGYFTLTHKAIDINGSDLSNTSRRKLEKHSRFEEETDTYSTSAFLLAQFGKNYNVDGGKRISGMELMECAMDVLYDIQHRIGGGVVYLDAEERPELEDFYSNKANYKRFGERYSKTDKTKYIQYMRFL